MNLNKSSCWLSSSLAATVLPWQSNISLMMIDFLCNLGASFFLLPSNFDSLYSLLFIVGLLSLFFLVVSATLGSSMSPFRPSDQFLLCWWNWGFTSNWKSYLNISYCFLLLVELSVSTSWLESCLLISCFFCCKVSSGTFNNWSLMLTFLSWPQTDDWICVINHHIIVLVKSPFHFFHW